MKWYIISKKTLKCLGSLLNAPEKMQTARVFYMPETVYELWKSHASIYGGFRFGTFQRYSEFKKLHHPGFNVPIGSTLGNGKSVVKTKGKPTQ